MQNPPDSDSAHTRFSSTHTVSVIIAAHNEAKVIGACLDSLLTDVDTNEVDIVVVPNGCTDATAKVAAAKGVRVIELAEAGKANALNAGDAAATGSIRIYLDADVVLSPGSLRELITALTGDAESSPLAVMPRRRMVTTGRPLAVRAYYAINTRLPVFADALFGRGVIGISAIGRERFNEFPDQIADDLFLDSLFSSAEKLEVATATAFVQAPRRTRDLIRSLARVRAGNNMLRNTHVGVRPSSPLSWLRDVVLPRPWLAPAAVVYVVITLIAAFKARRHPRDAWGRDNSTR